ncbi:MAG: threonine-phosphate decarboxylase [Hyphomicrobiales bacterium]|nr:threonine-phosphate decarboxylase [Hyphomicrobiales bacterium]
MKAATREEESRMDAVYHGGDLAAASSRFPAAPRPFIDLSTGINPHPYPVGKLSKEAWTRLPEPSAIRALEAIAATAYRASTAEGVVAAPGAQALIQLLPRLVDARRVGVLGFTYAEHEASWRAAGASVSTVEELDDLASFDVAVVVNPNNPDGRRTAPHALAMMGSRLARGGGTLIVDEAFMDAEPFVHSLVPSLPLARAVVLRSFGKFYGLAGLRLGFAIASPDLAEPIRRGLGPWAVSGVSIEIGSRALADRAWRERAIRGIAKGAARLDAMLARAGFEIIGGTPLFRLARHSHAPTWFERLGRQGISVRSFPSAHEDWLRFGLPGAPVEWRRLEAALSGRE